MEYIEAVKYIKKRPIAQQLTDDEILDGVKEVEQSIKNYCCIPQIPDSLFYVLCNMTVDLLTFLSGEKPDTSTPSTELQISDISSIKIGDTTVTMGNTAKSTQSHSALMSDIVFNYREQLNTKRRIW